MATQDDEPLIYRLAHAAQLLGVSPTTLWRLRKTCPDFPSAVRVSDGTVGLYANELREWLRTRRQEGSNRARGVR